MLTVLPPPGFTEHAIERTIAVVFHYSTTVTNRQIVSSRDPSQMYNEHTPCNNQTAKIPGSGDPRQGTCCPPRARMENLFAGLDGPKTCDAECSERSYRRLANGLGTATPRGSVLSRLEIHPVHLRESTCVRKMHTVRGMGPIVLLLSFYTKGSRTSGSDADPPTSGNPPHCLEHLRRYHMVSPLYLTQNGTLVRHK